MSTIKAPDRLEEANHLIDWEHSTQTLEKPLGAQTYRIIMRARMKHLEDTHDVTGFSASTQRTHQLHLECHLREAFKAGVVEGTTAGIVIGAEAAKAVIQDAKAKVLARLDGRIDVAMERGSAPGLDN